MPAATLSPMGNTDDSVLSVAQAAHAPSLIGGSWSSGWPVVGAVARAVVSAGKMVVASKRVIAVLPSGLTLPR